MRSISIIIPAYNEEKNISLLYEQIKNVLIKNNLKKYEIIFVDDGSEDSTFKEIMRIAKRNKKVKAIRLKRNYGQTAAISMGIKYSTNDVIILMDADGQNDPADIPLLLKKIEQGYDVVSGWRYKRKDNFILRVLPSKIANYLISVVSGVKLRDYGCTLKAYKKEFIKDINLYGEMHRFIPIYTYINGAKITEIKVKHHPRKYGKSKYGLSRIFKVMLDLLVVKFLEEFYTKPIYFFGGVGFFILFLGVLFSIITLVQKYVYNVWVHKNPLLILSVMLVIIGIQFIIFGILAEIEIRTFFQVRKKSLYKVEKKINI